MYVLRYLLYCSANIIKHLLLRLCKTNYINGSLEMWYNLNILVFNINTVIIQTSSVENQKSKLIMLKLIAIICNKNNNTSRQY